MTALIEGISREQGVTRRKIAPEEIVERLIYPMINEGARILEEGVAARPGDIDVVWLYGYGWPAWRGGPMFHADQVGLDRVAARLAKPSQRNPPTKPCARPRCCASLPSRSAASPVSPGSGANDRGGVAALARAPFRTSPTGMRRSPPAP